MSKSSLFVAFGLPDVAGPLADVVVRALGLEDVGECVAGLDQPTPAKMTRSGSKKSEISSLYLPTDL